MFAVKREDMVERQRREHPLRPAARSIPIQARHCSVFAIRLRCDRIAPFGTPVVPPVYCSRPAPPTTHRPTSARRPRARVLQHGEAVEAPIRHGVPEIRVGEIECPALEGRHEVAEPRDRPRARPAWATMGWSLWAKFSMITMTGAPESSS